MRGRAALSTPLWNRPSLRGRVVSEAAALTVVPAKGSAAVNLKCPGSKSHSSVLGRTTTHINIQCLRTPAASCQGASATTHSLALCSAPQPPPLHIILQDGCLAPKLSCPFVPPHRRNGPKHAVGPSFSQMIHDDSRLLEDDIAKKQERGPSIPHGKTSPTYSAL
jgi:hypothetical protein